MTTPPDLDRPVGLADVGDLSGQLARWFAIADLVVTALVCTVARDPLSTALSGGAAAVVVFGWLTGLGWLLRIVGGTMSPATGGLHRRRRLVRASAADLRGRTMRADGPGAAWSPSPSKATAPNRPHRGRPDR